MALDVLTDFIERECPHCGKKLVLRLDTNYYGGNDFGAPTVTVDSEKSVETDFSQVPEETE